MAEARPPIRCCRCGVEIADRHDEGARVRLAILFGVRPSLLWRAHASPWPYLDLCRACARAFDRWIGDADTKPQEGTWLCPPAAEPRH